MQFLLMLVSAFVRHIIKNLLSCYESAGHWRDTGRQKCPFHKHILTSSSRFTKVGARFDRNVRSVSRACFLSVSINLFLLCHTQTQFTVISKYQIHLYYVWRVVRKGANALLMGYPCTASKIKHIYYNTEISRKKIKTSKHTS